MEENKVRISPRRLARMMAKAQLDRRGVTGYNKPSMVMNKWRVGPSRFSQHWKHFAVEASQIKNPKGAKKK